jgi:hypothetical protein
MVSYYKKIFIFKVYESWFTYNNKFRDIFSLYVAFHLKNIEDKNVIGVRQNSYTIELSLEQDSSLISSNFSKQIRQQSKLAENEGTTVYFHNDIEEFVSFFNDFATKKNTFMINQENIIAMGNDIKLSFAVNSGQILAAHSYLLDTELGIVRHLHSATRRLDEHYDRNLIGRANKLLTVRDIFYFKEVGFKLFDFGGYAKDTEDESLKGINNYKLLFGGHVVTCIDCYSYSYWFLKKISKFLGLTGRL